MEPYSLALPAVLRWQVCHLHQTLRGLLVRHCETRLPKLTRHFHQDMPQQYDRLRGNTDSQETLLGKEDELFHRSGWSNERWVIAVETTIIGLLSIAVLVLSLRPSTLSTHRRSFSTDFGMWCTILAVAALLTVCRQTRRCDPIQAANLHQSIAAYLGLLCSGDGMESG